MNEIEQFRLVGLENLLFSTIHQLSKKILTENSDQEFIKALAENCQEIMKEIENLKNKEAI